MSRAVAFEGAVRPPRGEEGAVAVEFAIVLPIFLAIVFGMIGFGLYLSAALAIESAAHAGARASVAGLNPAGREEEAQAAVEAALGIYGGIVGANVAQCETPSNGVVCFSSEDDSPPGYFRVRVAYRFGLSDAIPFVDIPDRIIREAVAAHGGF